MKYLIICLLLSGCASNNLNEKITAIEEDKLGNQVVYPNEYFMSKCDDLPRFEGKTLGDLYEFTVLLSQKYYECANKAETNQNFIKEVYKK